MRKVFEGHRVCLSYKTIMAKGWLCIATAHMVDSLGFFRGAICTLFILYITSLSSSELSSNFIHDFFFFRISSFAYEGSTTIPTCNEIKLYRTLFCRLHGSGGSQGKLEQLFAIK